MSISYFDDYFILGKRKSAVELLQESKAFYVKSEIVLDRKQELKNSGHLQVAPSTAPSAPPRLLRKCGNPLACSIQQQAQQQQIIQQSTVSPQLPSAAVTSACCWANCRDQDRRKSIEIYWRKKKTFCQIFFPLSFDLKRLQFFKMINERKICWYWSLDLFFYFFRLG